MINDYSNGGLKMIDIQSFNKSLKATWVKKYLDKENQGKWKLFFDKELQKYGGTLAFMSNLNKEDTTNLLNVSNCFISEILSIWSEVNFEDRITSENQFHDQCLWYNSLFRINNLPVFYKDWLNKGIRKVKDLKDSHNNFLSLTDFQSKYNLPTCPLKFYGLLSAIKSLWSKCKGLCNQNPQI